MAKEHQVLVIAKNTAGIGARILALFNRRGFNVTKMTSGITNTPGYARITLTVEADDRILDQIQKQIYKLIDVVKVKVFEDHDVVCRELMLIKVKATAATRSQIVLPMWSTTSPSSAMATYCEPLRVILARTC